MPTEPPSTENVDIDLPAQVDLIVNVTPKFNDIPENEQKALFVKLRDTYATVLEALLPDAAEGFSKFADAFFESVSVKGYSKVMSSLQGLLDQSDTYAKMTREISEELMKTTGLSISAAERSSYGVDNLAKRTNENMMGSLKMAANTKLELENGQEILMSNISLPTEMLKTYSEAVLKDTRLYKAAAEGVNDEILISAELARKRLGISADSLNEIMQREYSETGKITGEMLGNIEKSLLATAQLTGDNVIKLSNDVQRALKDYTHFGMMTEQQVLSLSTNLGKLGLSMDDLAKIADKFQTFDGASKVAADIAAATGVALDTQRLFELSLSEPQEFLKELISEMQAGGIDFDQLGLPMQNYLSRQLSIDPTLFKRMMNADLDELEDITADITAKANAMTDQQKDTLLAGMQPVPPGEFEERRNQQTQIQSIGVDTAKEIEKAYAASGQAITDMLKITTSDYDEVLKRIEFQREKLDKISTKLLEESKKARTPTNVAPPPPPTPQFTVAENAPAPPAQQTATAQPTQAAVGEAAVPVAAPAPQQKIPAAAETTAAAAVAPASPAPGPEYAAVVASPESPSAAVTAASPVGQPEKAAESQKTTEATTQETKSAAKARESEVTPTQNVNISITLRADGEFGQVIKDAIIKTTTDGFTDGQGNTVTVSTTE